MSKFPLEFLNSTKFNDSNFLECPEPYARWFCLNGATCFSVKVPNTTLYSCWCPIGYHGVRCDYKYIKAGQSNELANSNAIENQDDEEPDKLVTYDPKIGQIEAARFKSQISSNRQSRAINLLIYDLIVLLLIIILLVFVIRLLRRKIITLKSGEPEAIATATSVIISQTEAQKVDTITSNATTIASFKLTPTLRSVEPTNYSQINHDSTLVELDIIELERDELHRNLVGQTVKFNRQPQWIQNQRRLNNLTPATITCGANGTSFYKSDI